MIDCKHYNHGRCSLIESIVPESAGRLLQTSWCKFCKTQVDDPTAENPGPVVSGVVVQLGKQLKRPELIQKYEPHREKIRSPSLLQQAGSAVAAFAKFLASGGERVSDEERDRRKAICRGCQYFDKNRCKICGCFLTYKVQMPLEECPIGRWETTPRRQSPVERCLASAIRAGFTEGVLFAEPESVVPKNLGGWSVVQRSQKLGAYPNRMLALAELYFRNPNADAYLMMQDDVEFVDADVRR